MMQRYIILLLLFTGMTVIHAMGDHEPNQRLSDISLENIPSTAFVSTWDTNNMSIGSTSNNQIKLPLTVNGTYNFLVSWGDGSNNDTITSYDQAEITHTYTSEGEYTIVIEGTLKGWRFDDTGDRLKIIEISQWGNISLGNDGHYFHGCENLVLTAIDQLDLSETTDLSFAFSECPLGLLASINLWNTSKVTDMNSMFRSSPGFNLDIGDWDMSSVTDMSYMFYGVRVFNQDISSWDVSSVTDMSYMFYYAHSFNQDIGDWNTSSVTDMSYMFFMEYWLNTFNINLGLWDVSNVIDMSYMFYGTKINRDLSGWNTSSVTNMRGMFYTAQDFDKDIGSWDVSSVTDMSYMFSGAENFNQDIGSWDVSSVVTMRQMFSFTETFNQDLGDWNVSQVADMDEMFEHATLSISNYNSLLIGWANLTLQPEVTFSAGDSRYSYHAINARQSIVETYNWSIVDIFDSDYDNDGMDDLYELDKGLNPEINDRDSDLDGDGMSNYYEYLNGLLVNSDDANLDKDGDEMTNLYEYENGLEADKDDSTGDADGDGMHNLYEYLNGLLAGTDDAEGDIDEDGMPNLYEYQHGLLAGTDDASEDIDEDGIPNLYEYQHGLNNSLDDAEMDLDGDGLSNLDEYMNGTDPGDYNFTFLNFYIYILLGVLLIGILTIFFFMRKGKVAPKKIETLDVVHTEEKEKTHKFRIGRSFSKNQAIFTNIIGDICDSVGYDPQSKEISYEELMQTIQMLLNYNEKHDQMPSSAELFKIGASLDVIPQALELFNAEVPDLDPDKKQIRQLLDISSKISMTEQALGLQDLVLHHSLNFMEAKVLLKAWSQFSSTNTWPEYMVEEVKKGLGDIDKTAAKIVIEKHRENAGNISSTWVASKMNLSLFQSVFMIEKAQDQLAIDMDLASFNKEETRKIEDLSRSIMLMDERSELSNRSDVGEVMTKLGVYSIRDTIAAIKYYTTKVIGEDYDISGISVSNEKFQSEGISLRTYTDDGLQNEIDKLMEKFKDLESKGSGKI